MTEIMPTSITKPKQFLTLASDKGEYLLTISMEELGGEICLFEEKEEGDTTGFYCSINRIDWEEIKKFIDNQFKIDAECLTQ